MNISRYNALFIFAWPIQATCQEFDDKKCLCAIIMLITFCTFILKLM